MLLLASSNEFYDDLPCGLCPILALLSATVMLVTLGMLINSWNNDHKPLLSDEENSTDLQNETKDLCLF